MSITAGQKTIFSKILIAIDGSDASMDAADYAISISEQYDAELYALHVIHQAPNIATSKKRRRNIEDMLNS